MSTDPHPRGGPRNRRAPSATAIAVAAGVLVVLLLVLAIVLFGGEDSDDGDPAAPLASLTATPLPATPTPTTPAATETATDTAPPPTTPTEPTDADAAAFARTYSPPGADDVQRVQADLNDDGVPEVVVVSIVEAQQTVRVDIGAWTGEEYEVVFTGQGGAAESYRFTVRDYTGDDFLEVVTEQSVGAQGASLSVWGWDGAGYGPQVAQGGCWDGSNTYGIIGAEIRTGQITASCDASPLPTAAWPSDVYVWDGDAWVFERTRPA